jgi:hypothetical protein
VQAVSSGGQASDQEVLPRDSGDPAGQRGGERVVGVGIARPFIARQLQAGHRVLGQILLVEVIGIIEVDCSQGAAEPAQQITSAISAAGTDDHLGTGIGARLYQRQDDPVDDLPRLRRVGGLVERVDDDVEPPPSVLA